MKIFFLNHAIRVLLGTNGLIMIAGAMIGPIYALFVEEIGGDLLDASLAGAVFAITAGFTTFISGKLSDSITENKILMAFGYACMGSAFLLYTQAHSMFLLLVAQGILGFGEAIYAPVFDKEFSRHIDAGKGGSEWGIWESMRYFTTAIGALVGGYFATIFGFGTLFIAMGSLCFISATYVFWLPKKVL